MALLNLIPVFCNGRDVHGISTRKDRVIATIMIILAVATSSVAISTNLYSLFLNKK